MENLENLDWKKGLWRLADPKISLASLASIFLGACAAAYSGPLSTSWLVVTLFGVFCVEVAKNASGEIYDFQSGTDLLIAPEDRTPFSGGKRVLVDGLLTKRQTVTIACLAYGSGILLGLIIVVLRNPDVLWLGVFGTAAAFFYHAPPLRLSYRGMGEFTVGLCYGPLICSGTFLVQTGHLHREVVWVSVPLGILIAAFLLINEFPDYRADQKVGKRTLVVRLGPERARLLFGVCVGIAFLFLAALPMAGLPSGVWLGAIAAVPAGLATQTLLRNPLATGRLIPAQKLSLFTFVTYALGSGIGILVVS